MIQTGYYDFKAFGEINSVFTEINTGGKNDI